MSEDSGHNPYAYEPAPPHETGVRCARCGYDLSGSPVGGSCPECGTAVQASLRSGAADTGNAAGVISLVLGIIGVTACALIAPIAWYYSQKTLNDALTHCYDANTVTLAKVGKVLGIVGTALIALQCLIFTFIMSASH